MNTFVKSMLPVVAGVLVAGVIMHYGRQFPGLEQAHGGFDS